MYCRRKSLQGLSVLCGLLSTLFLFVVRAASQEFQDAEKLFLTGKYEDCLQACEDVTSRRFRDEDWPILHAKALLAVGRYPQAEAVISNALSESTGSIRLRLCGMETATSIGNTDLAAQRLKEINNLATSQTWGYRDPSDIVALGRTALFMGADPRMVLEKLYSVAQRADPNLRDAYLAMGELALEKHDFAIAASKYSEALKKFPDDPDMLYGLARAYQPNARSKMAELLETALSNNTNHVPSLLLLADSAIDAEEYTEANKILSQALKVNPWNPEAWAYRAVIAHLRNDSSGENEARNKAFHFWPTNPKVDHLIGVKLSQDYRFAEGSACQQRALNFDTNFLPARVQLAEDLLRLGQENEGWKLAELAHQQDGYDVTAYNLVALRGTMQKFKTLTNEDFVLRMSPNEADLYGDRALALLNRAKARLAEKYGINPASPTVVEIFPEQKDFGVRTFGMPHNPGFLGVCFGRVITANSPASQGGNPENWEAVLWHEFCHVITLQLTKNKMPRWLSEGISVYEELQANRVWGQTMNPRYREMVLGEDLTPVSELSSAFMSPKSDLHVQFAYYESELVVEYLVGKFGFENLKAILRDLGDGVDINVAIPKHTAPMKQIEEEFATFAKSKAKALGPGLDWERPKAMEGKDESDPLFWARPARVGSITNLSFRFSGKPNFWTLMGQCSGLVADGKWTEAKAPLKTLIELYPDQSGPDNVYALLAAVHRNLHETSEERVVLAKWAALDAHAPDAYLRLMELARNEKDWKTVTQNAERFLAVNPLVSQPYRFLGLASEELAENKQAIDAYQKLLLLDPADPADVHFRLAKLLQRADDPAAKRHVLQALEEAPRFREAHHLLLELANGSSTNPVARLK